MTKGDIHGLAVKAANDYKRELERESKLTDRPIFDKAAECYQAGYERALLENFMFENI